MAVPSPKLLLPQERGDESFRWMAGHCSFFSISMLFRWQLLDDMLHGSEILDLKNSKQKHLRTVNFEPPLMSVLFIFLM